MQIKSLLPKVDKILAGMGYKLISCALIDKKKKTTILRFKIKQIDETPIFISDCSKASKAIEIFLDDEEQLDFNYCLEVSSGGLKK